MAETQRSTPEHKDNQSFKFSFESKRSPKEIYELLLQVNLWWSGLFDEHFESKGETMHEDFTFSAGQGLHFTRLKLVEAIPEQTISWIVSESNLSFLTESDEWNQTIIRFDLSADEGQTSVTFLHDGLTPLLECYESCTSAWSQYLDNLANHLK